MLVCGRRGVSRAVLQCLEMFGTQLHIDILYVALVQHPRLSYRSYLPYLTCPAVGIDVLLLEENGASAGR